MVVIKDSPLTKISQDKLGREPIVQLVVDSINEVVSADHPCIVYGIYGKWGEGKSSFMSFIKEKLQNQGESDGINIVEFNPWLVCNDDSLLREFFKSIVKDATDGVKEAFKKYAPLAIFASKTIVNAFLPGVGSSLANGIDWAKQALDESESNLAELKEKVSDAIVESNRHLLVMIDDVDRLDKEELHTMMRVIRQVADFKNTIYIIGMDVDMVAKSISSYYGHGAWHDGMKFIDKIVQVPIVLPQIPQFTLTQIVRENLGMVLNKIVKESEIDNIVKAILPFINTCRDIKRYCNQLSFVLPHMKDEVNIYDLCVLEAIKMADPKAYGKILEKSEALRRVIEPLLHDKIKTDEIANQRYNDAIKYITEDVDGSLNIAITQSLKDLFQPYSLYSQNEIDQKRLNTDIYFPKYFTQIVPGDLIPDRELDSVKGNLLETPLEMVIFQFNEWLDKYSPSEVKRAALYLVRKYPKTHDGCKAASIVAKALSMCKLAKGLPKCIAPDGFSAFVAVSIIYNHMFAQDKDYGQMNVIDKDLLDETFTYIFEHAEINFCLNLIGTSDRVFTNVTYNGQNVIPVIANRFLALEYEEQIKFSKHLLIEFFTRWKYVDNSGFNAYANGIINYTGNNLKTFLDKFIDGDNDTDSFSNFLRLFDAQIPLVKNRLKSESEEVLSSHGAKIFLANPR